MSLPHTGTDEASKEVFWTWHIDKAGHFMTVEQLYQAFKKRLAYEQKMEQYGDLESN